MEDVDFSLGRFAPLRWRCFNQLGGISFLVVRSFPNGANHAPGDGVPRFSRGIPMVKALFFLLLISILSGCASSDFGSPNTYQRYDVQRIGQMEQATVIRVRPITIESNSDSSGLSSVVSSVAGAFLGSQVIGNGRGRYISGALSGSATGVIAQRVSSMMSHHSGLEVFLLRANGQTVVVSQVDDRKR